MTRGRNRTYYFQIKRISVPYFVVDHQSDDWFNSTSDGGELMSTMPASMWPVQHRKACEHSNIHLTPILKFCRPQHLVDKPENKNRRQVLSIFHAPEGFRNIVEEWLQSQSFG